jgi:hypothetical protein
MKTALSTWAISEEDMVLALEGLGEDPSAESIQKLGEVIGPTAVGDGDRSSVVNALVADAVRALRDRPLNVERTMDAGKRVLDDALTLTGASRTVWGARGRYISPWEYCTVNLPELSNATRAVDVGVSSGGVVSVNGDPFTPNDRILNVTLDAVVTSLTKRREQLLQLEGGNAGPRDDERTAAPREAGSAAKKAFAPTPTMIAAALSVLAATAKCEVISPIVRAYQSQILVEGQWKVRADVAEHRAHDGSVIDELIEDPKDSYLMSDADFAAYDARCKEARDGAGLWVADDGHCPKLVAEEELRKAERRLIEEMTPVTNLTVDQITGLQAGEYRKYVDLTLRLLAPYVADVWSPDTGVTAGRGGRVPIAEASTDLSGS